MDLKDKEGYPLTVEQFRALDDNCAKLFIPNDKVNAFKMACYRSMVRYIPVSECLNELDRDGSTAFFTKHILPEDLFRLGRIFEEESNSPKNELSIEKMKIGTTFRKKPNGELFTKSKSIGKGRYEILRSGQRDGGTLKGNYKPYEIV